MGEKLEQSDRREKFLMQRREQGRKKRANERKEEKEIQLMQRRENGIRGDEENAMIAKVGIKREKWKYSREQEREFRLSKRKEEHKQRKRKGEGKNGKQVSRERRG